MQAQLLMTDGTVKNIAPENGKDFTLAELYKLIGTDMVELVHLPDGNIMIVDEEGKLKNNAMVNLNATLLLQQAHKGQFSDLIVGNTVVCPSKMFK